FGREGGREGLYEYVRRRDLGSRIWDLEPENAPQILAPSSQIPSVDRTPKMYIGGKQQRPDSGYSRLVDGGEVGEGNRKDIRNAVEAARAALPGWSGTTAYNRAQILYYVAENLSARSDEFAQRLGPKEVEDAIESL